MGNCLRAEEKTVRVMKMDGKVLEYKPPVKVFQVLSEFKGHMISDTLIPGSNHLYPHTNLLTDRLYHLIPVKVATQKKPPVKKKVSFSIPAESTQQVAAERQQEATSTEEKVGSGIESFGIIKLVITKTELRKMIENGLVSMDGSMTAAKLETMKKKEEVEELVNSSDDDDDSLDSDDHTIRSRCLWKPSLVSIPEGNYCYS